MQDVSLDRGQRLVQQPLRGGNPRTREFRIVPHSPPVDRRGWNAEGARQEQSRHDTPGPAALTNPGARAASPGYTDAGATHHQIPARRTLSMPRRIPLAEQGMRDPWTHSKT
jgi:hypothetical protein